uniref:Carbonic anhydrase n=1 Tax=Ascaris lumbricoides TaxID=6252 RepID=A0A9J2Q540_ASCLU
MHIVAAVSIRSSPVLNIDTNNFSYEGENGPENWPGLCTHGSAQSPININIANVVAQKFDELIFQNYDKTDLVTIVNNGHTEALQGFLTWSNVPTLSGGGLGARYKLREIHFHWAASDDSGSEHTLDRLHYPLEAHLVHIREDLSVSEASVVEGGSAVLAVFFAISDVGEPLQPYEAAFNTTVIAGTNKTVNCQPSELLPTNRGSWFRYNGSFTTPTCDEVVTWTVLTEPLEITEQQVALQLFLTSL